MDSFFDLRLVLIFKTIETTCLQYQIRYVPVAVDEKFEKILLTYLAEKQKFG